MDQHWKDININKIKILFTFHKESMSFVMDMDLMASMFQVLLLKLFTTR